MTTTNEQQQKELTEELTEELTQDEINYYEEIASQLAKKYNVNKVHVYIGVEQGTNERVVGYLREPNYMQKIFAMDKIASVGIFAAGDELRSALTLQEESDPKTYSSASSCDGYRLGMTSTCIPIIDVIKNSFKKK